VLHSEYLASPQKVYEEPTSAGYQPGHILRAVPHKRLPRAKRKIASRVQGLGQKPSIRDGFSINRIQTINFWTRTVARLPDIGTMAVLANEYAAETQLKFAPWRSLMTVGSRVDTEVWLISKSC
jgi:hypothetical protein